MEKITMRNSEALQALWALRELAELALPVAGALRVRQVMRALQALAEDVEAERMKLLKAHAIVDEKGQPVPDERGQAQFEDGKQADYTAAHAELMEAPWQHEYGIRVSDLGTKVEVKPSLLVALGNLLEE